MKRSVLFIFLVGLLFSLSLVSAAEGQSPLVDLVNGFIKGLYSILRPLLDYVIGETSSVGDISAESIFFAKILLLVILISLVYVILENVDLFSSKVLVLWIISIGVGVLGVRFLESELISTILLPYSVIGVAITAGLPFIIYFIGVEKGLNGPSHKTVRRVAWIFFAVIFLALYSLRQSEIPQYAWIYPFTALLAVIVMFFDGSIQRLFFQMRLDRAGAGSRDELVRQINRKIQQVDEDFADGLINAAEHTRLKKTYRTQLLKLIR